MSDFREFVELLERAGVDTVREPATRNAENLVAQCAAVNEKKKLTRRVPSVEVWSGSIRSSR